MPLTANQVVTGAEHALAPAVEAKGLQPTREEFLKHGGMSEEEFVIPRLSILKSAKGDLKAGTLVNNVTGEPVNGLFIPLFSFSTYIKFNGMRVEWISMDRTDPRVIDGIKWGTAADGKTSLKPLVTQIINFAGYVGDNLSLPAVVGFKRTSLKAGVRFNTTCFSQARGTTLIEGTFTRQFNIKHRYELVAKPVPHKDYGEYFELDFAVPKDRTQFEITDATQKELWEKAKEAAFLVAALSPDSYESEARDGASNL